MPVASSGGEVKEGRKQRDILSMSTKDGRQ